MEKIGLTCGENVRKCGEKSCVNGIDIYTTSGILYSKSIWWRNLEKVSSVVAKQRKENNTSRTNSHAAGETLYYGSGMWNKSCIPA